MVVGLIFQRPKIDAADNRMSENYDGIGRVWARKVVGRVRVVVTALLARPPSRSYSKDAAANECSYLGEFAAWANEGSPYSKD